MRRRSCEGEDANGDRTRPGLDHPGSRRNADFSWAGGGGVGPGCVRGDAAGGDWVRGGDCGFQRLVWAGRVRDAVFSQRCGEYAGGRGDELLRAVPFWRRGGRGAGQRQACESVHLSAVVFPAAGVQQAGEFGNYRPFSEPVPAGSAADAAGRSGSARDRGFSGRNIDCGGFLRLKLCVFCAGAERGDALSGSVYRGAGAGGVLKD
jgi:hypothetical protein